MNTMVFLILFPMVIAALLLLFPQHSIRKWLVGGATVVLIGASIYLVGQYFNAGTVYFGLESAGETVSMEMLAIEVLLAVIVIALSVRRKQYLAAVLMLIGAGLSTWFELANGHKMEVTHYLFIDQFSLIMTLIIGVTGSLIALYAVGYMKDYHHHHPEIPDRSNFFFFIIFIFLGAMYGVVFSNHLMWLFFFWEITTLCSFFLIGYSKEDQAVKNAFRAIKMNLFGGIGFVLGIIILFNNAQTVELSQLPVLTSSAVLLPAGLLAFAGITKSAQLPFSSWLLGAMVAPTPVSALLHSSTMVKAGVYLIVRLSPVFAFVDGGNMVGLIVALVGAVTFLLTSLIAITQNDAKRVLAYSTIANLGLIVLCAGIGSYQLVWAAIMLIIFHAIAKSLLFLSVGTVEHHIGNRLIESMDGLIVKMPKLAVAMVIGIAGMFLAPFGMLISKWAAIEGLVAANPILTVFIAFGSAATIFFWTKWMGKILIVKEKPQDFKVSVPATEKITLSGLSLLVVIVCLLFPWISQYFIEPMIAGIYGQTVLLSQNNVLILLIMMALILILPLRILTSKEINYKPQYLSGLNLPQKEHFKGAMGITQDVAMKNYYLTDIFEEKRLFRVGVGASIVLILIMLGVGM